MPLSLRFEVNITHWNLFPLDPHPQDGPCAYDGALTIVIIPTKRPIHLVDSNLGTRKQALPLEDHSELSPKRTLHNIMLRLCVPLSGDRNRVRAPNCEQSHLLFGDTDVSK